MISHLSKAKQSFNSLVPVFISLFLLCPQMCHANTRDGLVGWWKFDEASGNAVDSSWQGNTGTATGTTIVSSCKRDNCRRFNGTSDFVAMGSSHYNFTYATPFSGCAWINTTQTTVERLFGSWSYQTSPGWSFEANQSGGNGKIGLQFNNANGGTTTWVSGGTGVNDGKWHHACFTYDGSAAGSGVKLYVDGNAETNTVQSNSDPGTLIDNGFNVGKINGAVPQYWSGSIDDVRVYNRVLTAQEVKDLYNPGMVIRGTGTTLRGTGTKLNY